MLRCAHPEGWATFGARAAPNPFNAWSFPPQDTHTLAFVAQALGELMGAVDGADAAPSPDARTGYAKLASLTDATLAAWDAFKRDDLAALNASLRAAKRKPIEAGETP